MTRLGKAFCAFAAGLLVAASLASPSARAQTWPQRSVRFIVSLGPGSGADIGARLIADQLTAKWKQPVVVENRPGGDAVVAINAFIGAKDDHTLLYTPTSSFTAHPFQMPSCPTIRPSSTRSRGYRTRWSALVVPPSLKIDIGQGVDRAGQGAARQAELFDRDRHDRLHLRRLLQERGPHHHARAVSRRRCRPLTDLGEGRIQAYVGALAIVQPHVQAGRVKLIAVTNSQRAPTLPDMPTVAEAGFPELTFDGLIGLFGPRDMPDAGARPHRRRHQGGDGRPRGRVRLTATGQVVSPGTAAEFAESIEGQRAKLARDRETARRQAAVALKRATTSSGIGCARRPPGRLASRTTQSGSRCLPPPARRRA